MNIIEIKNTIEKKVYEADQYHEDSHEYAVIMRQVETLQRDFVSVYNATHDGRKNYAYISKDNQIVIREVGYME